MVSFLWSSFVVMMFQRRYSVLNMKKLNSSAVQLATTFTILVAALIRISVKDHSSDGTLTELSSIMLLLGHESIGYYLTV